MAQNILQNFRSLSISTLPKRFRRYIPGETMLRLIAAISARLFEPDAAPATLAVAVDADEVLTITAASETLK